MARRFSFAVVVIVGNFLLADFKCVNNFATICEQVADIRKYAKSTWDVLIIKASECNSGRERKNEEVLEAGIFNKTHNLEQLYISEKLNLIGSDGFSGLQRLKYLKLWGNQLKVLRKGSFSNFHNLLKLDLRNNQIENLVHGFCENSYIKEIDLSFNVLTNIQVNMLYLPTLENLKLTNNRISFMAPHCFHSSLLKLNLGYNSIENFSKDIFENLVNLQSLILTHNNLKTIPSLFALKSIEIVDFSHNSIETLHDEVFANLPELKTVYLDNNHIKDLNPTIFTTTPNINTLHLHRNNLTSLNGDFFENALLELKEITIGANPWFCECLLKITQYLKGRGIELTKCEMDYFGDGTTPVCVSSQTDCGISERLSDDVYEKFMLAMERYKCDRDV